MTSKTCDDCYYWDHEALQVDISEATGGDEEILEEYSNRGYCRRSPPIAGEYENPWESMVLTRVGDWCGEHRSVVAGAHFEDITESLKRIPEKKRTVPSREIAKPEDFEDDFGEEDEEE